jgi:hypothetical protein
MQLYIQEGNHGFLFEARNESGNTLVLIDANVFPEYLYDAIRNLQGAIERYNTKK